MILNNINYEELLKITPIVKYVGGKRWLSDKLIDKLSNRDMKIYSEPFVGGLGSFSVILSTLVKEGYERVVLNDTNTSIISLYNDALYNKDELITTISKEYGIYDKSLPSDFNMSEIRKKDRNSRRELLHNANKAFLKIRERFNSIKNNGPSVELSSLFSILQMIGFNGMYRENSRGMYNTPYGWAQASNNIPELLESRIVNINSIRNYIDVKMTNKDFREVEYNKDTLYYLDPPYVNSNQSDSTMDYIGKFTMDDHKELIDLIKDNCFVYSNHNNTKIIDYFDKSCAYDLDEVFRSNKFSSKDKEKCISEILISSKRP